MEIKAFTFRGLEEALGKDETTSLVCPLCQPDRVSLRIWRWANFTDGPPRIGWRCYLCQFAGSLNAQDQFWAAKRLKPKIRAKKVKPKEEAEDAKQAEAAE